MDLNNKSAKIGSHDQQLHDFSFNFELSCRMKNSGDLNNEHLIILNI